MQVKIMKWRTKFDLNKKKLGFMYSYIIYCKANKEANEMLLEASYGEERRKLLDYEINYDWDESSEVNRYNSIKKYRLNGKMTTGTGFREPPLLSPR
jgi:hypothetical protein